MSYILDALKRADAERERGRVPGLHSQPDRPVPEPAARPRATAARMITLLVLLVLGAGAFLGWHLRTPEAPRAALPTDTAAIPATPPATAASPMQATPMASPAQPRLPPDAPPRPLLAPAPLVTAEAPPTTVRRFADLPAEQRAQLPQLNVNGASYSENPAHRMLIVNGQVLKEGQEVAPGLVLEHIGPHDAVLQHRGQRLSIGY